MKKDYSNEIESIHYSSNHNNLTFFVGAGVSRCSGLKGWKQLIQELDYKLNGIKRNQFSSDDFLSIAEAFYHKSKEEYNTFLKENFSDIPLEPNEIHDLFFQFKPVNFITTNFDNLLEKAAVKNFKTFISVSKEDEIALVNGEHYIIKAHGDYKSGNIVFKDSDYMNYESQHKLVDTLIKSIFASNLVIFIGYSLQDYTIRYILNWVHNCLKEKFKPIFIYTDDSKLLKSDIEYQESRGLRIIDWHDFFTKKEQVTITFKQRYTKILNEILNRKNNTFLENDHKRNFDLLYKKLLPLDSFLALRHEDIIQTLKYFIDIPDYGRIINIPSQPDILKLFIDYCKKKENNKSLPKGDIKKFETILSVFKKAGVFYTVRDGKKINFENDYVADKNLILFDYKKINAFVKKTYTSDLNNYKKAYYLFTLGKYKEAYQLYQEILFKTFYSKKYVLYYLAQKNVFNLHEMKSFNSRLYDFTEISNLPQNEEDIFEELPKDFKTQYCLFSNMYNLNNLYKKRYQAQTIAEKIENTNTTNTIELGLTSFWKGSYFILNSLHFVLGNYLLTDEFIEFKASIKVIMEQQLFKSTEIGKQTLVDNPFNDFRDEYIIFDEIDFYCFIKYFTQKEINEIFTKYNIETLLTRHEDLINQTTKNLFNYYANSVYISGNQSLKHKFCNKLAVCLEVLTNIVITASTVEYIANTLLNYSFTDIPYSLCWRFFSFQNKNSTLNLNTKKIILAFLIRKIKERKEQFIKTKKIIYNQNDYDFPVFAEFLENTKKLSFDDLDAIISNILDKIPDYPIKELLYYYPLVNDLNKSKIRELVTIKFQERFDVGIIINLVHKGAQINATENQLIHKHLEKTIINNKAIDKEEENTLIEIGFLCYKGNLDKNDFKGYLGYAPLYDFLLQPEKFPENEFDIKWIANAFIHIHEYFSNNPITKKIINKALTKTLKDNKCSYADKKYLTELLIKYYS